MVNTKNAIIMGIDITKFNRSDRRDIDRMNLRKSVAEYIVKILEKLNIPNTSIEKNDTGDGLILLFLDDTPKELIIDDFMQNLQKELLNHNRVSADIIKIQVRCILHCGDVHFDESTLSKDRGFTSKAIVHACRLLDSKEFKDITQNNQDEALVFGFSEDFFYSAKEIVPRIEDLCHQKTAIVKDGTLKFFSPYLMKEKNSHDNNNFERIQLNTITGTCFYLPIFDCYNMSLYQRKCGEIPLKQQLEAALLFGDHVVVHCADPLRSKKVLKILEEYSSFIVDGTILFLLGRKIENPKRDYFSYIQSKIAQYDSTVYGKEDVNTLDGSNLEFNQSDPEEVVELLVKSPFSLHRGFSGTDTFRKYVKEDFAPMEKIVISIPSLQQSKLNRTNLTLFQLLTLSTIDSNGKKTSIINDNISESIIDKILSESENRKFSRRIVLNVIKDKIGITEPFNGFYDKIEERMCLLFSRINFGDNNFYIECTRDRDKTSPFFYEDLYKHLTVINKHTSISLLGKDILRKFKSSDEHKEFVRNHLSTMAMIHSRRMADYEINSETLFLNNTSTKNYTELCTLLNGAKGEIE